MSEYNPLAVLEAVVDEVDGLRRTDPRSFIPRWLMEQAREAIAPVTIGRAPGDTTGANIRDIDEIAGRTIAHVFENGLNRGDLVLVFTDRTFIALEASGGDRDADISVVSTYGMGDRSNLIETFVHSATLAQVGLISGHDAERIKREEQERQLKEATASVARAKANLARVERDLAALQPTTTESPA